MTAKVPTPEELEWGRFASRTTHYVLSNSLTSALWPKTGFLRRVQELASLKQQKRKDIYLVGSARTVASLIDAGLVDELRLIVYAFIASDGKPLFATPERRYTLRLRNSRRMQGGRVCLNYELG